MNATKQLRKDSLALRGKRPSAKAYSANFLQKVNIIYDSLYRFRNKHNTPRPVEENLLWQTNARDKVRSDKAVR